MFKDGKGFCWEGKAIGSSLGSFELPCAFYWRVDYSYALCMDALNVFWDGGDCFFVASTLDPRFPQYEVVSAVARGLAFLQIYVERFLKSPHLSPLGNSLPAQQQLMRLRVSASGVVTLSSSCCSLR